MDWTGWLEQFGGMDRAMILVRATLLMVTGLVIARWVSRFVGRILQKHAGSHHATLWRRGIYYLLLGLFIIMTLIINIRNGKAGGCFLPGICNAEYGR